MHSVKSSNAHPFFRALALITFVAIPAIGIAATASTETTGSQIRPIVYPFEMLMAGKRGKVEASFLIDREGRLKQVAILKSDAPEFSEAVRAYADATDFSIHVKAARNSVKKPQEELIAITQKIEFDDRTEGKIAFALSTPSPAARAVLVKLKADPNTKEFDGANQLDEPLQIISQIAPVFPRQLQGTHQEGSAVVEFYVSASGWVLLPRTVKASDPAFGYSACESVASWRFTVPMRNGKPVVVRVRVPINYSLNATPHN